MKEPTSQKCHSKLAFHSRRCINSTRADTTLRSDELQHHWDSMKSEQLAVEDENASADLKTRLAAVSGTATEGSVK